MDLGKTLCIRGFDVSSYMRFHVESIYSCSIVPLDLPWRSRPIGGKAVLTAREWRARLAGADVHVLVWVLITYPFRSGRILRTPYCAG